MKKNVWDDLLELTKPHASWTKVQEFAEQNDLWFVSEPHMVMVAKGETYARITKNGLFRRLRGNPKYRLNILFSDGRTDQKAEAVIAFPKDIFKYVEHRLPLRRRVCNEVLWESLIEAVTHLSKDR